MSPSVLESQTSGHRDGPRLTALRINLWNLKEKFRKRLRNMVRKAFKITHIIN
jgi:hypothetical protein